MRSTLVQTGMMRALAKPRPARPLLARPAAGGAAALLLSSLAGCRPFSAGPAESVVPDLPPPVPRATSTAPAAAAPPVAVAPPAPASTAGATGFAPIDYFDEHCARCHGPYGSFYGEAFARQRDDATLRKVVKEMADGPGNAPLEGVPLELLVAYHRSLIDRHPFLCLTRQSGGGSAPVLLSGEATPGSTIKVETAARTVGAKLEEHTWTVELPASTDLAQARLAATREGLSTSLDLARSAYSHAAPAGSQTAGTEAGQAASAATREQERARPQEQSR